MHLPDLIAVKDILFPFLPLLAGAGVSLTFHGIGRSRT